MLSLGTRLFLQSLEPKEDETTELLLENSVRANEILIEVLYSVYNSDKSKIGAYDAETTLAVIEKMVAGFKKGLLKFLAPSHDFLKDLLLY